MYIYLFNKSKIYYALSIRLCHVDSFMKAPPYIKFSPLCVHTRRSFKTAKEGSTDSESHFPFPNPLPWSETPESRLLNSRMFQRLLVCAWKQMHTKAAKTSSSFSCLLAIISFLLHLWTPYLVSLTLVFTVRFYFLAIFHYHHLLHSV